MRERLPHTESSTAHPAVSDHVLSRRRMLQASIATLFTPAIVSSLSCAPASVSTTTIVSSTSVEHEPAKTLAELEDSPSILHIPFRVQVIENGVCVWEGTVAFTSPTTLQVNGKEFSCAKVMADGTTVSVPDALSMVGEANIRSANGIRLEASLGSISISEESVARIAQSLDAESSKASVQVGGINCDVQPFFSREARSYTAYGEFESVKTDD